MEKNHSPESFRIHRDDSSTHDYCRKKGRRVVEAIETDDLKKLFTKKKSNFSLLFKHLLLYFVLVAKNALLKRLQAWAHSLLEKEIHLFQIKHTSPKTFIIFNKCPYHTGVCCLGILLDFLLEVDKKYLFKKYLFQLPYCLEILV